MPDVSSHVGRLSKRSHASASLLRPGLSPQVTCHQRLDEHLLSPVKPDTCDYHTTEIEKVH